MAAVAGVEARSLVDRSIARVNAEILTESDLGKVVLERRGSFAPMAANAIDKATSSDVRALFDRTLLTDAAKMRKISAPETEMQQQVERMVNDIRAQFSTEAEFRKALAEEQMSVEELKKQLLKRAKLDYQVYQLVNARFTITEADARKFEQECAAKGESPLTLHLRRLAVPVEGKGGKAAACAQVSELAARIFAEGMNFEDGIRKYSKVPGAKEDAGDLGYLSPEKLAPDVAALVRNLEVGQASTPVVTGGYASIFYVEGKHGARSLLLERRFSDNREALLKELRRKAHVQVLDARLMRLIPPEYADKATVASTSAGPKAGAPTAVPPAAQDKTSAEKQTVEQVLPASAVPQSSRGRFGAGSSKPN